MDTGSIIALIQSEMKPSMGCTEPVAVGLAVSRTCSYLREQAESITVRVSSNIFKNAYNVKIPNTDKTGVALAATLGFLLARPDNTMEIFAAVDSNLVVQAERLNSTGFLQLEVLDDCRFYIEILARNAEEQIRTITLDSHDNLILVERNGEMVVDKRCGNDALGHCDSFDIAAWTLRDLLTACETVDINDISFLADAVAMNRAVSAEGMAGDYGMNVGKSLRRLIDRGIMHDNLHNEVRATVAAACDCRMGGGCATVMTVAGSGNQGIEAILPVATVGKILKIDEEKILRGVMMSIITTIYIKSRVGRLSPICSAIFSGAASAGSIVWLMGGNGEQIEGAVQNVLGNLSAMLCDGAKDGCALKLATCAGEAVVSAWLALEGSVITACDGIIHERVEDTVGGIARLSKDGMADVDKNIIGIIMDKSGVPTHSAGAGERRRSHPAEASA